MANILQNIQLAWGVCKIGAYTIFQRMCCIKPHQPRPDFAVICVGLDNSGKTTLLSALAGEDLKSIQPTSGFMIKPVQLKDVILNVKEIGGGEKVRPFWKHYFQGTQAITFVIDSSSSDEEIELAKEQLENLLCSPVLRGLPLLILANCQDKEGARNEQQMKEMLDLGDLCSGREWDLYACSHKDLDAARDAFTKLSLHLLPKPASTEGENPVKTDHNRIVFY